MLPEANDDSPIEEAPGRIPMEEEDGRTLSLIDVMDLSPRTLEPMGFERKEAGIGAKIGVKIGGCHGGFRWRRISSDSLGPVHGSFVSDVSRVQGGGRLEH
jgi:hypothetical protein